MMKSKGQGWALDVMVASAVFITAIMIFFFYSINYNSESTEILDSLQYDGNAMADVLLTSGFPINWTDSNVIVPGLLINEKIDEAKLSNFSKIDYQKQKSLLNTKYEFCFTFDNPTIKCYGKSYNSAAENLILISRITIYQNKPALLKIFIWQE